MTISKELNHDLLLPKLWLYQFANQQGDCFKLNNDEFYLYSVRPLNTDAKVQYQDCDWDGECWLGASNRELTSHYQYQPWRGLSEKPKWQNIP